SERTELKLSPQPSGQWQSRTLPVPPEWIGTWVQLVAEDHVAEPTAWLAFSLPILPSSALSLPVDTSLPESGFCPDGVYSATKWPSGKSQKGIRPWGSYCAPGDSGQGGVAPPPMKADSSIVIYAAGYHDRPGLILAVENIQKGLQMPLHFRTP